MRLKKIFLFLLLPGLLTGVFYAKKIDVRGKLVDATAKKSEYVSSQDVQLVHYITKKNEKGEWIAEDSKSYKNVTGEEGDFLFEGINVKTEDFLVLMTHYKDAHYEKNLEIAGDTETYKVEFEVYNTTDNKDNIRIASHHVMYTPQNDYAKITEFLQVQNTGKKTYIGVPIEERDFREVLHLDLPEGFEQIELSSGFVPQKVYRSKTSIIDTSSIKPGMKQFRFSYKLPVSKPFLQRISYPTDSYSVILETKQSDMSTDDFKPVNLKVGSKKNIKVPYFKGKNLKPGQKVGLKYSGAGSYFNRPVIWIIGVGLLLLAVVITLRFFEKDKTKLDELKIKKEKLLDEIAELDDDYENNEIPEQKYRKLREEKKNKLVEITKEIENSS